MKGAWQPNTFWIRENGIGILFATVIAVVLLAPAIWTIWTASPIVRVTDAASHIVSFVTIPSAPEYAIGGGFRYSYAVELLDTGAVVSARDRSAKPHPIGTIVSLQRVEYAAGGMSYQFKPN